MNYRASSSNTNGDLLKKEKTQELTFLRACLKNYKDFWKKITTTNLKNFARKNEKGPVPQNNKEVIEPQVPLRLPCYDLAPLAELGFEQPNLS